MDKKRIAIIQPYIGKVNRGNETYFVELTKFLRKYYDIDIYSTGIDFSIKDNIIQVNYEMKSWVKKYLEIYEKNLWLKRLLNRSRYFVVAQPLAFYCRGFARKVYRDYLRKEKYDLLFPGIGKAGMRQAVKYRKHHGSPIIYKGGGGIGPGEWHVLKQKPNNYICISAKQLNWAKQFWDECIYIPNGTYVKDYQKGNYDTKYNINPGHKLVISVGNLDMNFKRHQLTINAVSKLENVDLLLLGKGEAEEQFRMMAMEKMPGRFDIKSVSHTEVPFYYYSADVFTLPSLNEPFGIVYIEAMAAGLPVVATDDEVRREIIGDAGILCDVENADIYAAAIKRAINGDWGDLPFNQAKKYDYSVVGEQYHQMIDELIEKYPYHS